MIHDLFSAGAYRCLQAVFRIRPDMPFGTVAPTQLRHVLRQEPLFKPPCVTREVLPCITVDARTTVPPKT